MSGESTMKFVSASVANSTTVERGDLINDLIEPASATELAEALALLASLLSAGIALWKEQKDQPKEEIAPPQVTVNVQPPMVNVEAPQVTIEASRPATVNVAAPNVVVDGSMSEQAVVQDFSKVVWVLGGAVFVQFLLLLFLAYKIV